MYAIRSYYVLGVPDPERPAPPLGPEARQQQLLDLNRRLARARSAMLVSSSLCRRSRIWRLVTNLPSVPASGLVLTMNCMDSVGSSIFRSGSASGWSGSVTVQPRTRSSIPVIWTMSPAWPSRITSYNVCYTKLLRARRIMPGTPMENLFLT